MTLPKAPDVLQELLAAGAVSQPQCWEGAQPSAAPHCRDCIPLDCTGWGSLGFIGLHCTVLNWTGFYFIGFHWIALDWILFCWIALDYTRLDCVPSDSIGLHWIGFYSVGFHWIALDWALAHRIHRTGLWPTKSHRSAPHGTAHSTPAPSERACASRRAKAPPPWA